ncbi:MAG: 2-succinyl-5-enolpyruvyl-6-hydroxy-3-cyclohexene-1-carboxylic-acid synthase [Ignavibacteriales bacterium]|nr:2-succinyl-5-enolpyruvyl-6-hydroxy-3-cyclohexene-1-carboxylic-acid synthase [Ignavibacteriales bacterium]
MNKNYLWSKIFVERLKHLGVRYVCISPGSRNTPLVYAFAKCNSIKKYVIIDERTSGFFALGLADKTNTPVCIITTSGTAVVELYPAIVEAYKRRIPLIICTADRPPKLQNCGANQTIKQENIFINHIRAYYNAGLPEINDVRIEHLLNITDMALYKASQEDSGPVHINFPFEKPLEPKINDIVISDDEKKRYLKLSRTVNRQTINKQNKNIGSDNLLKKLKQTPRGLIIVGCYTDKNDFKLIAQLSEKFNYPILADGLSGYRFGRHSKKNAIINYGGYINLEEFQTKFDAEIILQFGYTPTSKQLLEYYKNSKACKILINEFGDLYDPSKTTNEIIKCKTKYFCEIIINNQTIYKLKQNNSDWLSQWKFIDKKAENIKIGINKKFKNLNEINLISELFQSIHEKTNLMISNSLPPRDIDYFTDISHKNINVFSNRGASGIDGIVSTALGIASNTKNKTILIVGDLSFYYDINALYIAKKYSIPLVIILINNQGGGIFEMLPTQNYEDVFDEYFKVKHNINYEILAKGFGCKFYNVKGTKDFQNKLKLPLVKEEISILQIKTNSKKSADIRKNILAETRKEIKRYLIENQN